MPRRSRPRSAAPPASSTADPAPSSRGAGSAAQDRLDRRPLLNPAAPFRVALRQRNLRVLFAGLVVSQAGDWLYNLALLAFVYERTGSSAWVGITTAARILPEVVLGPIGGVLADRLDRRGVMIVLRRRCGPPRWPRSRSSPSTGGADRPRAAARRALHRRRGGLPAVRRRP